MPPTIVARRTPSVARANAICEMVAGTAPSAPYSWWILNTKAAYDGEPGGDEAGTYDCGSIVARLSAWSLESSSENESSLPEENTTEGGTVQEVPAAGGRTGPD